MASPLLSASASAPSFSPSRSPLLSPNTLNRRLSARRGSVAAADPWGQHSEANYNPERNSSSRLTIVRVTNPTVNLEEPPRPGSPHHHRRLHRRQGSAGSIGSADGRGGGRLSFASASFGGPTPRPGSPTTSRPHSPVRSHSRSGSLSHHRLSPEELVDMARASSSPSYMPSPRPSPGSPYASHSPEKLVQPAQFTPLPDDVYLPFLERPSEVSALLSTYPTAKLWALLQQMFPGDKRGPPDSPLLQPRGSDKSVSEESGPAGPVDVSGDPANWDFTQLAYWLKHVDRDVAPDEVWVKKARRCVASHSELIWERLKGALGVPADLDADGDEEDGAKALEDAFSDHNADISPANLPSPFESRVAEDRAAAEVAQIEGMDPEESPEITIEPIVVPTTPPLNSQDPAGGLQEIQEEESETNDSAELIPKPKEICQGLRIVTSPSSPNAIGPVSRSPFSFAVQSPSPNLPPLNDGGSVFSSPRFGRRASVGSHYSTGSADVPFDVLRERGPGHPLFPSNFANLALGPTLTANNPSLRRPSAPPPPAYSNPHAIRSGVRGRRNIPSWADGYDPAKHEHAITIGSASSVDD
ncbi:hypothetical protein GLOTRDRAFT_115794 [Gloeophyllum trabeum ATCC 11539]|uniref:Uncharacterized protein n=1 Tax=Gloeophyllum trabeum (strain ATCC 11539 / FP-39264 / Madison 617) TaxID=670483 RepID=S7QBA6_GLOTA|nr:uncharacterized protein GLOTRDRAFT_115794 [Gloeophyllum trabeum ATCC 11539]EPQ56612.1 hypothetical protein GLOTRDRAFT_115794 [Gloeophyllum trabeum ATCC 11539]